MNYEMGSSEPLLGAKLAKIGADAPIYPRIFVLKNAFCNSQYLNIFKEGEKMRKQDALFQDVIDNIILYRCDWKIGDSKVITVRTKGRNLNAAKIKLVKKLGYKTHDNKDASLLKLFDTIEKIYDIKFVDFAFV